MKLQNAWLCADLECQEIGEQSGWCAVCGCTQLVSLASILNREFPEPAPPALRSHEVINAARALARIKLHEHASRKLGL